jgi:hypothetical protein
MWRRLSLAVGTAVILALGASSTYAVSNTDSLGYAALDATTGVAEAYVRILAGGQTQVQVRLSGLTPGSQPVWRLLSGSTCSPPAGGGGAAGTVLITPTAPSTISSLGVPMTSATFPVAVPVSSVGSPPNNIAIRVYASVDPTGVLGPEIGCDGVHSVPDLGTQHWW